MENYSENIVIGGTGFIGSALCRKLGSNTVSISRTLRQDLSDIKQVVCDISDREKLANYLKKTRNLFILTGQISQNFSRESEINNLKNILNSLNHASIENVFYFSSALVYGEAVEIHSSEDSKTNPIDEYSKFKVESESILRKSNKEKKWKLVILRLSNVYGNPQNKGFIGFVLRQIFEKNIFEVAINGDGNQTRDYIFIDDVIDAIINIMDRLTGNDIINISTGKSYNLLTLIREINANLDRKIKYEILHNQINEVKASLISNDKLRIKYGFVPAYSLSSGIKKTLENYKNFYKVT